ncbi:unnamed protein product [Lactuca saligna]|uniref:Reverse transcriptase zinc-binding domain-containing protein n=1 Tax=Lactuca saligna TaxID=75948 RepID=A0AA35UWS1_LACSI|nr:unnamed protein product [Lactuca saligna]
MGRIPVAVELSKRGVSVETKNCLMCNEGEESTDHVLVDCPYARRVFEGVFGWCGMSMEPFHSVKELVDSASRWGRCQKKRELLLAIYYGTIWCIWKSRNERVFKKILHPKLKVIDFIKSMTYLWVKNTGEIIRMDWATWSQCPLL